MDPTWIDLGTEQEIDDAKNPNYPNNVGTRAKTNERPRTQEHPRRTKNNDRGHPKPSSTSRDGRIDYGGSHNVKSGLGANRSTAELSSKDHSDGKPMKSVKNVAKTQSYMDSNKYSVLDVDSQESQKSDEPES